MLPGRKGYVKTSIFFSTYNEALADEVRKYLELRFKLLTFTRSNVVKELYFAEVEGNVKEYVEELLSGKTLWYKVDVLEFK